MDRLPHSVDRTLLCHCAVKLAAPGLCEQAWRNRLLFATKVEGHDVGKCRRVVCHVSRDHERYPRVFVCSEPVRILSIYDCQLLISFFAGFCLCFLTLHFDPLFAMSNTKDRKPKMKSARLS